MRIKVKLYRVPLACGLLMLAACQITQPRVANPGVVRQIAPGNIDTTIATGTFKLRLLTQQLIDEWDLSEAELSQLRYYLSDRLEIVGRIAEREKFVTADHRLLLTKRDTVLQILFKKELPGKPIAVEPTFDFWHFRQIFEIRVSFEKEYEYYLSFRPASNGVYRPVTRHFGETVLYEGREFHCPYGCTHVALLVSVRELERIIRKQRTASGNTFAEQ